MLGGDENSAKDMALFIHGCNILQRKLNAAVMPIHHTGKTGSSERGSSALRAACDMMIDLSSNGAVMTLKCAKSKDDAPFPERYYVFEEVTVHDGSTSRVPVATSRQNPVEEAKMLPEKWQTLELLNQAIFLEAGAKRTDIDKVIARGASTIARYLSQLKVAGYLRQSKKGDPFFITEEGKNLLDQRDAEYNQEIQLVEDDI
jgi:hypothetical protein